MVKNYENYPFEYDLKNFIVDCDYADTLKNTVSEIYIQVSNFFLNF